MLPDDMFTTGNIHYPWRILLKLSLKLRSIPGHARKRGQGSHPAKMKLSLGCAGVTVGWAGPTSPVLLYVKRAYNEVEYAGLSTIMSALPTRALSVSNASCSVWPIYAL